VLPPNFTLLQVTPELDTGGVEQTTVDIARAVVEAGGRALVASRGGRMEPALAAAGGELVRLPAHSKNPFVVASNARRLEALIRREGVHVVHARSRAPAFSALAAARRTGRPFVATYHGVYTAKNPLKRWYNAVMTRGDLVIANSEYTRAHVVAEHGVEPGKVVAIPRGVDLARFDPDRVTPGRAAALRRSWGLAETDPRPTFLLAGRLTRWKGQAFVVAALDRAFPAGMRAKCARFEPVLILAGDDQGREAFRAELERLASPLGDRVRLVGHCDDMPPAYLAVDVALAPSLDPEAFGRTAVEPQAMGRPVLAADHGATAETVEHGVTGCGSRPATRTPGPSPARSRLLVAERRAVMGAAGRERVRRLFSLERMQADTLAVYARVLEGRR
jgi:glycosyltransferase involved in cell wall biosynthesis